MNTDDWLRHSPSGAEQLLYSWPFFWETAIRLAKPQTVSHANKSPLKRHMVVHTLNPIT